LRKNILKHKIYTISNGFNNKINKYNLDELIEIFKKNITLTMLKTYSNKSRNSLMTHWKSTDSFNERNHQKETLEHKGTISFCLLAPELPTEIAHLIAEKLLITEHDAATLRQLGDLV
jgi:hypothetical protein